jgi:endonuclease/exonuclease/phosphatase family metal-dependent hydrolase
MKPNEEPAQKTDRGHLPDSDLSGRHLRIVTYNILGGRNTDGSRDLSRVAEVIRTLTPDLAALQEVDVKTLRMAGADMPAELARLTGLKAAFAEAMPHDGGSYGEAVLTRLNVTKQTNHPLPYRQGHEPRVALELQCEIPGIRTPVILIATHLDHLDDDACRLLQIARLRELFTEQTLDAPAILAGDLNAAAESAEIGKLCEFWQPTWPADMPGFTWPADKPTARIDHVLIQPTAGWKVVKTYRGDEAFPGDTAWRELLNRASDHLPVVLEVEIAPAG